MVRLLCGCIDRPKHGAGFFKALARDLQGLRGQRRLLEQCFAPTRLLKPVGTVLSGNDKVLAARAR
jgi:hypothetical protein